MTDSAQTSPARRSRVDGWKIALVVILILAIFTRLVALGDRAVSHDETTHAKYSWNLYSGRGFRHDPLMHGPLLFEATALFYALFGVSDFSARLYTALTGIALVMVPWLFRRWLGRLGSLLASVMLLISPSIAYYSRYTRHDIPIILFSTLLLWAVLRYLEEGKVRWLGWTGIFFALMYATKENAYIYTAIFAGLMALPLIWQMLQVRWERPKLIPVLVAILVFVLVAGSVFVLALRSAEVTPEGEGNTISSAIVPLWGRAALGFAFLAALALIIMVTRAVGEVQMRRFRLFDVLLVLGSFTLPLGSALLMNLAAGVDMSVFYPALMSRDFSAVPTGSVFAAAATLVLLIGVGVALGLWWDTRRWPTIAIIHYGVFFVLYSTLFTYGWGGVTGLVGGLAYWIAQQGVERGNQPWYYYGIVGPLYEYAPILISMVGAVWLGVRGLVGRQTRVPDDPDGDEDAVWLHVRAAIPHLLAGFLLLWALLSWGAYAVAGEKMPWLFVHIAYPHILLAALVLGRAFHGLSARSLVEDRAWLVPVSLVFLALAWVAFTQSSGSLRQILEQSGAGEQLALTITQLQPLGRTLGGVVGVLLFAGLLVVGVSSLTVEHSLRLIALTGVLLLGGLTTRTMIMLNYINDELAKEYIVYAHSTPDVSMVLDQLEALSWRLTGTPDQLRVAYGSEVAWPFYWYMDTQYPNNYYFVEPEPDRLLESPVILAASSEWSRVEAIIGDQYDAFDYKHIWWPVEDYKDLTWDRIRYVVTNAEWRRALWDIAWARDYSRYARLKNPTDPFTLKTWPHRLEFRLYLRRDLAELVWDYRLQEGRIVQGGGDGGLGTEADPFSEAEQLSTSEGWADLPGSTLRGIDVAPDGTIYVADSANHRIWHLDSNGDVIAWWGEYGAGPGQFSEPWDVAVDADGNVYVADVWNHRVQKFDAQGQHLLTWGRYAQAAVDDRTGYGAFFGPRGIAVGPDDLIYVADTGNRRVQVFDASGQFVHTFGGSGERPGLLGEFAGLDVSEAGQVFIADAWNRRIQVFDGDGVYLRHWDVASWAGVQREYPQLGVAGDAVVAGDPAYQRALLFEEQGSLRLVLDGLASPFEPSGVILEDGSALVANAQGGQILSYSSLQGP